MIINLSDPFTANVAGGITIAIILGAYHYVLTLVKLNTTNKKLSDVLSEMYSINAKYEKQIANIQNKNKEIFENVFREYQKQTKQLLEKYHRLIPPARLALLESLYDEKHKDS